ncbi:MAG: DUF58 domain-containing protein [Oscillospiraceae bacterium]|nr:DUF58 domain-containing protein [Oscillospiraceae bacterium]
MKQRLRRGWRDAKRCALYLLVLALCFLPPVYLNDVYGYLPIFTLLFVSLLSIAYLLILARHIGCEDLSETARCVRGTPMAFSVRVENRSPLACPRVEVQFYMTDLYGGRDASTSAVITLAPFEKRTFTFDARFDHLGCYTAGLERLTVYGPLGVLYRVLPLRTEHSVEVMPHIWEPEHLQLSDRVVTEDSRSRSSVNMDGADYTGVREYVVGDPIKNIHWKLSAHTDNYLTRQTEVFGSAGVTVILDLCRPGCGGEVGMCLYDALVETATAVCNQAIARGMENDLNFFDRAGAEQRLELRDTATFDTLPSLLPPLLEKPENYPVEELLRRVSRAMYARNNVVLCTGRVTEETVRLLQDVRRARRTPILFFILPKDAYDRERDRLLQPVQLLDEVGIRYFVLTSAEELQ